MTPEQREASRIRRSEAAKVGAKDRLPNGHPSRFWNYVDHNGPVPAHAPELGPCWPWTLARFTSMPYGRTSLGGRVQVSAHRRAWELTNGPIPEGMLACHKCDYAPCCRPDHLFLGTNDENMADMARKGRSGSRVGEQNALSKLTEVDVIDIRTVVALGGSLRDIARAYGVNEGTVRQAVERRTWRHLP